MIGLDRLKQILSADGRYADWNWKGDIFGGLTTAVISLPLALAFGVASGAGAQAGLYGAVMVGLFAALFGGTRTLISEPTGPMTVVMTAVITQMVAAHPENGVAMAFAVVLVAGVTQILLGAFKLGRYVTLMPYSVISGFMSGIGILLILMQLGPLTGQIAPTGGATGVVGALPELIAGVDLTECLLAAFALLVLFFMPRSWRKWCPPHLLALVLGTAFVFVFLGKGEVRNIGTIPMGLPEFNFPAFSTSELTLILFEGLVLGLLGSIDTLLTAMIADSLTRKNHNSDRELIGQGIGNCVSSLFGGLPGAGATMGTVANIQVGARSPVAAITRAVLLLLVVLIFAPYLESIPMAVLAAIAVKVGVDILDWSFLKRAHKVSRSAMTIMYSVMFLTVFVDLIVAVGVGVFVANILTIDRLSQLQKKTSIRAIDTNEENLPLNEEETALFKQAGGKVLLLHLSGPMIFGVAKAIAQEQEQLEGAKALILDLKDVPILSTTVALALENVVREAQNRQVAVFICAQEGETRSRLERVGQSSELRARFCESRVEALKAAVESIA
ncbi:MAG TPA: SulP family inorganic anion transporter [Opitutales bacterium]|nr:SulP family inorganic anion transporter [Opitutales bacterium]